MDIKQKKEMEDLEEKLEKMEDHNKDLEDKTEDLEDKIEVLARENRQLQRDLQQLQNTDEGLNSQGMGSLVMNAVNLFLLFAAVLYQKISANRRSQETTNDLIMAGRK